MAGSFPNDPYIMTRHHALTPRVDAEVRPYITDHRHVPTGNRGLLQ